MKKNFMYKQVIQDIARYTVIDWIIVVLFWVTNAFICAGTFFANYYEVSWRSVRVLAPIAPLIAGLLHLLVWIMVTDNMRKSRKLSFAIITLIISTFFLWF